MKKTVFVIVVVAVIMVLGYWGWSTQSTLQILRGENSALKTELEGASVSGSPKVGGSAGGLGYDYRDFENINQRCDGDECLFFFHGDGTGDVIGYGHLTGYYTERIVDDFGELISCDGFLISGGSNSLIQNLRSKVRSGNSINQIDRSGNLIVGIHFDGVSETDKNIVLNSRTNKQADLKVVRRLPRGIGGFGCASILDIVRVDR